MSKMVDLTGKRFGKLLVFERTQNTKSGETRWLCVCDCGNRLQVRGSSLRNGNKTDCGKHRSAWNLENLVGERFGRLIVIERADNTNAKQARWICECECGSIVTVRAQDLKSGRTKSCGCYKREVVKSCSITHGMSKTRLWRIWNDMHVRCEYPSATQFKYYGEKGVFVCEEWKTFEPFRDWAVANGYTDELTIDRIDVSGNYTPSNCRWASWSDQQNNKSTNRFLTYRGRTLTVSQWAKETGISRNKIDRRLKKGWSVEKVLVYAQEEVTVSGP